MRPSRIRVTYANVVATMALFAALGGVSYAATELPKDSVGSEQLRSRAVRTGKIADGAVSAAKLNKGVLERMEYATYAKGAGQADSAKRAGSAASAEHADTAGDANKLGGRPAGDYMTANAVLQPGETEVGDFLAAAPSGAIGATTIQFWPHLPESVQGGNTKLISSGEHTTECPAPGQAEPGYMCVYEDWNYNMSFEAFISTLPGSVSEGPVSGVMYWQSHNTQGNVRGNWAYTAP